MSRRDPFAGGSRRGAVLERSKGDAIPGAVQRAALEVLHPDGTDDADLRADSGLRLRDRGPELPLGGPRLEIAVLGSVDLLGDGAPDASAGRSGGRPGGLGRR